jgi:hypothetical protein
MPAGQAAQVDAPAAETLPAGQLLQAAATAAPSVAEYVPAAHLVHTAAPGSVLYVPAAHLTHASWSGPVNPGLHTQLARPTEPLADCEQPVPPHVVQAAQSG